SKLDALRFKKALNCRCDIIVFMPDYLTGTFDDRHLTTHSPIKLTHFQSDIPGTHHNHVVGQIGFVQPVLRIYRIDALESGDRGNCGAGTSVEHNLVRGQSAIPDFDCEALAISSVESRMTTDEGRIVNTLEPTIKARSRTHHDLFGPL